jgi:hypothetical protein
MKNMEKLVRLEEAGGDAEEITRLTSAVADALPTASAVWAFRQVVLIRQSQKRLEKAIAKAQGVVDKAIEEAKAAAVYRARGAPPLKEPAASVAAKAEIKGLEAEITAIEEKNAMLLRVVRDQIRDMDEMRDIRQWRSLGGPMPGHLEARIQDWYEEKAEELGLDEEQASPVRLAVDVLDWHYTGPMDPVVEKPIAPAEPVAVVEEPARMRVSYVIPPSETAMQRRQRLLFRGVWRKTAERVMIPA